MTVNTSKILLKLWEMFFPGIGIVVSFKLAELVYKIL
jgi:hypothetical protein